jgi:hypothetical protein
VSPALPSLLNSSPIAVALKLHRALASTTHPPPFPITPSSLTDDPHHRGRPPPHRGPAIPSALRPNWPYHRDPLPPPVPCHHSVVTEPGPRWRTVMDLTSGRAPTGSPPVTPPSVVSLPLPLARGPAPTAPSSRHSPAGGPSGPPAHAAARARLGRIPTPAPLAEEISFLFLFSFSFPIYIYIDILCTKNSLNKF